MKYLFTSAINRPLEERSVGDLDKHQARVYSVYKSTTERSRVRHKLSCSRRTCDSLPMRERRRGNARFSIPEANLHASYGSYRIKITVSDRKKKPRTHRFYILRYQYLIRILIDNKNFKNFEEKHEKLILIIN